MIVNIKRSRYKIFQVRQNDFAQLFNLSHSHLQLINKNSTYIRLMFVIYKKFIYIHDFFYDKLNGIKIFMRI